MASRSSSQVGYDRFGEHQHNPLPPPPQRDTPYTSPLRRQHGHLPPVLSTHASALQGGSTYSTPLSSISRQSPWSAVPPSPMIVSVNTPISGPHMASRTAAQFNMQYDPRDWATGHDSRVAHVQSVRDNATEDGLASPPPPYSSDAARSSPRGGVERSRTMSVTDTPAHAIQHQQRVGSRSNASIQNRHSIHLGSYTIPLPPPPPSTTVPSLPRTRVVSDLQAAQGIFASQSESDVQPPSARRAASANAGGSRGSEAGPSNYSLQQRTWTTGMPLPGPPPGPPPATSRSQSTSAAIDRPTQSQPRPLRQTIYVSDLGAIPPTPLTWSEGQPLPSGSNGSVSHLETVRAPNEPYTSPPSSQTRRKSLYQDATTSVSRAQGDEAFPEGSPPTLSRSSAVRDNSTKGIRERRAQNRNSRVFDGELNGLSVQTAQTNPWASALTGENIEQQQDSVNLNGSKSSRLQPKSSSPLAVAMLTHDQVSASPVQISNTPPISPNPVPQYFNASKSTGFSSKSLPTPPLSQKQPSSAHSVMQPSRLSINTSSSNHQGSFQLEAIRRHNDFLEKENVAKNDVERLQLFAEYILQEASIRQRKYETALQSGDFDIDQVRSKLFTSTAETRSASNSISQVSTEEQDPATGNTTPQTRPETMWWKDYRPALSPIASMDNDEMSSRGRAPSRWWESQTGSHNGDLGARAVLRSKRESKYMGLSKEFLMAHSPNEEYPGTFDHSIVVPSISMYPPEKANPETFGYFEGTTPRKIPVAATKRPEIPALLDISRFITLPPPYPRHHPAVNNNHPDLAQYRTTVRTLGDLEEVKTRKSKQQANEETLRHAHRRKISDTRRAFKANIQKDIANGHITYKEAADAEDAYKMSEYELEKQQVQSEFDQLQDTVVNPLHDMLHGRLSQLDESIRKLSDDLHTDASHQDPDQPQEEGDEKPELLEKLTQLKWLFDLREQIHRECFALMSERNDKFKAIVLLPYQYSTNTDKIRDTEAFFDKDGRTRLMAYRQESLKRHESFLHTIDQHVLRGVELQSSAFWDIAPDLLNLIQKIPEDLRHFEGVRIPDKEYKENPSYVEHPQQYLYSLLSHAEKSTYQYIEGQINLQCLQHEVKSSLLAARYKSLEADEGHDLSDSKEQEEAALTAELKQKASMIEQQWLEALGSQLQATRERVKALLQEDNAWEEIAAEDA